MSTFDWEAHQRARDRILRPIREETGYPVDDADGDAFYDLPNDVIPEYISALESALVGTRLAIRDVGRAMRSV